MKKILLSAGGTGGHLFPAEALAKELEGHAEILFVGGKLASSRFFNEKFKYEEIPVSQLKLSSPFKTALALSKGFLKSCAIIQRFSPDLIIGFGSFYTFPLLLGARILRIPYILHEQNLWPGKVNRLFSKNAEFVALTFQESGNWLKGRTSLVEFPLRFHKDIKREEAYSYFNLKEGKKTILVFGGSQGASRLNEILKKMALKLDLHFQILHFTGKEDEKNSLQALYQENGILSSVKTFEKRMDLAFSIADIAIARAGASTLSELIEWEIPAILIPFPYASEGHQEANANYFADSVQGGYALLESELNEEKLLNLVFSLYNEKEMRRKKISEYKGRRRAKNFSSLVLGYFDERK